MVGYYGQGVPTTADLENNSNTKKYTINDKPKGKVVIPRLVCFFLFMGSLLMAGVAALLVFLLVPGCTVTAPEALTKGPSGIPKIDLNKNVDTRLPKNLEPEHYKLQIRPCFEECNFTSYGFISIEMRVIEATNKIVINLNNITVDKDSVRVKYAKSEEFMRLADTKYNYEAQTYEVIVHGNMNPEDTYKLEMNFTGYLNDLMQGFYRSSYVDSSTGKLSWMASTQFSPTDARRAFPCFDEPSFKARFQISIGRPAHMTSLSNMPKNVTVEIPNMENWYWDHYETTPVMSSYLVAFIVSDLQSYEFNEPGRSFSIWTRKDAINHAVYSSAIVPTILRYYEGYFGINYPLPKMDMVAVPDFGFNAMENWGLITFRETALLLDNKVATIDDKTSMALTVGHELAHQWFGNLATPKWWDDLWLKEGFATYFEYIGVNHVEPTWNITEEFIISEMESAFRIDYLPSALPLSFEVHNSDQIRQAFNKISYSKGAAVIRMMQNFLGEDTFKKALVHYLNTHNYKNANHDDLWKAFMNRTLSIENVEGNVTIKDVMDTWVTQPGFPVISAIADYDNQTVKLIQKRFFISGESKNDEKTWWVPISYVTKANPRFENTQPKLWIKNENETTFNLDTSDWWLLNQQQTGYYIVNYDEENWKKLIPNLQKFPAVTRAQLLSNSMDLARANLLDYDIPFRLILSVGRKDNHIVPYTATFTKIQYLYNMLITTPIFGKFNVYLLAAFNVAFDKTNFDDFPSDSYATQKMRRLILEWSCRRSETRCESEARHKYRSWMTTLEPLRPNVRKVIYCTAIREGGETEWNFAYQQYLNATSASEKNIILQSLGCSSKPWILMRYLSFIISKESGVRKQDGQLVFSSVANNIVGQSLAFNFLRSNWETISEYYGDAFNRISGMVQSLTTYMNSPYHLIQLEAFKAEIKLGTTKQAFDNAIETVKGNIRWMERSYQSVEKWLNDHSEYFGY